MPMSPEAIAQARCEAIIARNKGDGPPQRPEGAIDPVAMAAASRDARAAVPRETPEEYQDRMEREVEAQRVLGELEARERAAHIPTTTKSTDHQMSAISQRNATLFTDLVKRSNGKAGPTLIRQSPQPGVSDMGGVRSVDLAAYSEISIATDVLNLSNLLADGGNTIRPLTIRDYVGENSLLASLGLNVFMRAPEMPLHATGQGKDVPILRPEISGVSFVTPMSLQVVADGASVVPVTAAPVVSAEVDWSTVKARSARLELTRAQFRALTDNGTADAVIGAAIAGAVANMTDQVMYEAFAALAPKAFNDSFNGEFAAHTGVNYRNLKGISGGTDLETYGNLGLTFLGSIPVSYTNLTTASYIVDLTAQAVILDRDVRVVVERDSLMGNIAITVYAAAAPLVARPDRVWTPPAATQTN